MFSCEVDPFHAVSCWRITIPALQAMICLEPCSNPGLRMNSLRRVG
jgi:hypothetical protein